MPIDTFEGARARNARVQRIIRAGLRGEMLGEVAARVNHGRWIVDCPTEGCVGAELASEVRPFVCISCTAGPYVIVWPDERAEIEALLEPRPTEAQNWEPGETVEFLQAENDEHGVG